MAKLTIDDLNRIKQETQHRIAVRYLDPNIRIKVHMGECGIAAGARDVMKALLDERAGNNRDDIQVLAADCRGTCDSEPNVTVEIAGKDPIVYQKMTPDKMRRVFEQHVLQGSVVTDDVLN